jgi:predicted  nucleic acid-binding Zn-ribbon protein
LVAVVGVVAIGLGLFAFMQTGKLGDARLQISNLETNVDNLEADVVSLGGQLNTEKANASKLSADLSAANANVTKLTSDLDTEKANVSKLTSDLQGANANITKLTGDLDAEKANAAKLTSDLGAANANITKLTTDLNTEKENAAKLTSDLAAANTKVAATQASLDKATADLTKATTDLAKIRTPKHFSTVQELTDWLAADDTNTNPAYATLIAPQKTWVLQVKATRSGYIISAYVSYDPIARITYYGALAWVGNATYFIHIAEDTVELSDTLPFTVPSVPVTP